MVNVIIEEPAFTIRITGGIGAQGSKGDPGNGIASAVLNDDYTLTLNFTDGTSYTTEPIRGAQGETGNGIASAVLNPDYTLTLYFTDGTHYTTTSIRGEQGERGEQGVKGDPGFSPIATVTKSGTVTTVSITDKNGTTTEDILDGAPGAQGAQGIPGVSPTIAVSDITGGHRITITDAEHPGGISFDVMDGSDADAPVQDVLINGSSIVDENGDADIPIAGVNKLGAVATTPSSTGGITVNQTNGRISTFAAVTSELKAGSDFYKPVVPHYQHESAFYALAKAAGSDEKNSNLPVGQYTDAAKVAIQKMLGVYEAPYRLIAERTITEETGTITILADDNNNSFELTEMIVLFENVLATGTGHGVVVLGDGTASTSPCLTVYNIYNTTAQTKSAYLSVRGGRFIGFASDSTMADFYSPSALRSNKNAFGFFEAGKISAFKIASLNSHKFTSGKITIYGR